MKLNRVLSNEVSRVLGFNFVKISTKHHLPFHGSELSDLVERRGLIMFHRHNLYAVLHDWLQGLGYRPTDYSVEFSGNIIGKNATFHFKL